MGVSVGFISRDGERFYPDSPDRLSGLPEYWGHFFPQRQLGKGMQMTT